MECFTFTTSVCQGHAMLQAWKLQTWKLKNYVMWTVKAFADCLPFKQIYIVYGQSAHPILLNMNFSMKIYYIFSHWNDFCSLFLFFVGFFKFCFIWFAYDEMMTFEWIIYLRIQALRFMDFYMTVCICVSTILLFCN